MIGEKMKDYRIEFIRVQRTCYEREVRAKDFEDAERKFFRKYGKQFGGYNEIEIEAIEDLDKKEKK